MLATSKVGSSALRLRQLGFRFKAGLRVMNPFAVLLLGYVLVLMAVHLGSSANEWWAEHQSAVVGARASEAAAVLYAAGDRCLRTRLGPLEKCITFSAQLPEEEAAVSQARKAMSERDEYL